MVLILFFAKRRHVEMSLVSDLECVSSGTLAALGLVSAHVNRGKGIGFLFSKVPYKFGLFHFDLLEARINEFHPVCRAGSFTAAPRFLHLKAANPQVGFVGMK
jgi:hypothetical protein